MKCGGKHGGKTGVKEANRNKDQRWLEGHTKGDNRGGGGQEGAIHWELIKASFSWHSAVSY